MSIVDSINEARKRKVDDNSILQEIGRQNPDKVPLFQEAINRGANSTAILEEIIRQNTKIPAIGIQPVEPKGFSVGGLARGVGESISGIQLGKEIGKGITTSQTAEALRQIEEVRTGIYDRANYVLDLIKKEQDPQKRNKLRDVLGELITLANETEKQARETEKQLGSVGGTLGSGLEQALNIATLGTGSLAAQGLKAAGKEMVKGGFRQSVKTGGKELLLKSGEAGLLTGGYTLAQGIKQGKSLEQMKEEIPSSVGIGAAIPIVGKGLSLTKDLTFKMGKGIAGIFTKKEALEQAFRHPEITQAAIDYVAKNPKQPFLEMAKDTATQLENIKNQAIKAYEAAWNRIPENQTFDLKIGKEFFQKLYKGFGILLKEDIKAPSGINKSLLGSEKIREALIQSGQAKKFFTIANAKEVSFYPARARQFLTDIAETLTNAEKINPISARNYQRDISAAYDLINETSNLKPQWDKLVAEIDKEFNRIVEAKIPSLTEISKQYREILGVYNEFKPKIIGKVVRDKAGNVLEVQPSEKAETYFSNLFNENKGQARENINKLEMLIGKPIRDIIFNLNVAKALGADINFLKAVSAKGGVGLLVGAAGGGFAAAGTGGAAAMAALAFLLGSPKLTGKVAITSGKIKQKLEGKMPDVLKNLLQRAGVIK